MEDCLFCKIIKGVIPSKKVYEDDYVYAFDDINPQTPVHILIVPKKHIESAYDVNSDNSEYIKRIFEVIPVIAKKAGLVNGFRIISNSGEDAEQSVKHLHFHIMGGIKMPEKMV